MVNILSGKLSRIDVQRKFKNCEKSSLYEFVGTLDEETQSVYMDVIYKYKEYREYANYLLNDTTYVAIDVGVGLGEARKMDKYKSEDLCKQDMRRRVIASIICKSTCIIILPIRKFITHLLKKDEYSSLRDFLDKNTDIDMGIDSKLCEYVVENADIQLKVTTKAYEIIRSTITMNVKSYKKKVRVLGVKYEVEQLFNLLTYFEATVIEVIERSGIKIESTDIDSMVDILDNDAYTIEEMIEKVKEFDSKTEDYELRKIKRTYTFLDSGLTDAELIAMDKLEIARLNYINKLKKTKA